MIVEDHGFNDIDKPYSSIFLCRCIAHCTKDDCSSGAPCPFSQGSKVFTLLFGLVFGYKLICSVSYIKVSVLVFSTLTVT